VDFLSLQGDRNLKLAKTFLEEEIFEEVQSTKGNKSLDPEVFTFEFFKAFLGVLKAEVLLSFKKLYINECLLNYFSSYFITLIPKL